jgi:hypothetical protein
MASFSEFIQPILKFLEFCGLGFQPGEELGRIRYFHRIYAALFLSFNIGWNSYIYVKFFPNLTLSTINDFVDSSNFVFGNITTRTVMYYVTFGSFQNFCFSIQRLECLLEHDAEYYCKLRHWSWIALTFIVSLVLFTYDCCLLIKNSFAQKYTYQFNNNLTLTDNDAIHAECVPRPKGQLVQVFDFHLGGFRSGLPDGKLLPFFISALALAVSFQHVNSILAGYLQRGSKVANSLDLAEIRTNHGLVCQTVDQLNSLFQALSFIHVVFAFTGVVNVSFMMLTRQYFWPKIVLCQMETARFALLGYVCDRIRF